MQLLPVGEPDTYESAFATAVRGGADGLVLPASIFFLANKERLAELAAKYRLPAIYQHSARVKAGGLVSYGPNGFENFRQAATFVGKILKGAKPGDLPVEQPTRFELVINLNTAKVLGLTVPASILARADEVIE
jgi:putative ABC transport system substrate-binding protein